MMDLFEELLSSAAQKLLGTYQVEWQGEKIDLTPGWPRLPMHEAVKQYCGIDFMTIDSDDEAVAAAKAIGVELPETAEKTWGNALYECFDQKVEEKLIQPTFITMHPVDVSPLAKRSPKDPRLTERFELFICHSEMGNAFSELNDPIDQRARFQKQVELRDRGDDEAGMMDDDFITALEYGMPPTGGLGIGIDRCVMMLTGSDSIREVILFPTMKPLDLPKTEKQEERAPTTTPSATETMDFSQVEIEPLFADMVDFETFSRSDFRAVKVKACEAVPKSKKLLKFTLDDGSGTDRVILSGIHDTYEPEELLGKTLIAITNLPPRRMMGIDSCGMIISAVHHESGEERLHCLMVDDREQVKAALENLPADWKTIDLLINNAGLVIGVDKEFEGSLDEWDIMIDTNIKGLLTMTRLVVPGMIERGRGHVINIGSIAGDAAYPGGSVYCATKAAVKALSDGLRIDLVDTPLRVTNIKPGMVETNFSVVRYRGDKQAADNFYKGIRPLTGEDVAETVYFAASAPEHIQIAEVLLMPTNQATGTISYKKKSE